MAEKLKTYVVLYKLADDSRDYGPLFRVIYSLDAYAQVSESVWIVQTRLALDKFVRALTLRIDADDRLLVVECGDHGAWRRMEPEIWSWLQGVFSQPQRHTGPIPVNAMHA